VIPFIQHIAQLYLRVLFYAFSLPAATLPAAPATLWRWAGWILGLHYTYQHGLSAWVDSATQQHMQAPWRHGLVNGMVLVLHARGVWHGRASASAATDGVRHMPLLAAAKDDSFLAQEGQLVPSLLPRPLHRTTPFAPFLPQRLRGTTAAPLRLPPAYLYGGTYSGWAGIFDRICDCTAYTALPHTRTRCAHFLLQQGLLARALAFYAAAFASAAPRHFLRRGTLRRVSLHAT